MHRQRHHHCRSKITTRASADLLHSAPALLDAAAAASHHTLSSLATLHRPDASAVLQPLNEALTQLQHFASNHTDAVSNTAAAGVPVSAASLDAHSFSALYDLTDAAAASVSGASSPAATTAAQRSQDWLTPIADGLEWVLQVTCVPFATSADILMSGTDHACT